MFSLPYLGYHCPRSGRYRVTRYGAQAAGLTPLPNEGQPDAAWALLVGRWGRARRPSHQCATSTSRVAGSPHLGVRAQVILTAARPRPDGKVRAAMTPLLACLACFSVTLSDLEKPRAGLRRPRRGRWRRPFGRFGPQGVGRGLFREVHRPRVVRQAHPAALPLGHGVLHAGLVG